MHALSIHQTLRGPCGLAQGPGQTLTEKVCAGKGKLYAKWGRKILGFMSVSTADPRAIHSLKGIAVAFMEFTIEMVWSDLNYLGWEGILAI
jgi:hypothetical protein